MSRVYWTDEEWEAIALELYNEDKYSSWAVRTITDINRAQKKALPKERRRKIIAKQSFKRLEKELENVRLRDKATEPVIKEEIKEKNIQDFSTDEIMHELARRYIRPLLVEQNTYLIGKMPGNPINTNFVVKQRKKKVVIIGLVSDQPNHIRNKFGNKFNIQFLDTNSSAEQIKSNSIEADHVILVTKFIAHKHQEMVKSVCPAEKIIWSNGLISSVSKILEDL